MSWKFNTPPGWPQQPEGWQPPPGWAPDPSWPAAPPGWQFWVAANGDPQPPGSNVHDAPTSLAATQPASGQPGSTYPSSGQPAQPQYPTSGQPGSTYPSSGQPAQPQYPGGGQPQYPGGGQPGQPYPTSPYAAGPPPGPYPPAAAQPGGGGGKPWHQQWWAIGGTGLAVLLVGCLGGSAIALVTDPDDEDPVPPRTTTQPPPPTETGEPEPEPSDPPSSGGLRAGDERSGEGPAIIPLDFSGADYHTVTISYSGEGFFAASLVDDDGEYVDSLGSGSDGYTGVFPADLGLFFGGTPSAIDITDAGEGTWTVVLQDLNESPVWPDQTEGSGSLVLRVDPGALDGPTTIAGTHDGESNFIVWGYGTSNEVASPLLFNEIGEYSGDSSEDITADQVILHVEADGSWTLNPA